MSLHQADYPIATMCRVLEISTSGYYAWCDRPPSHRARQDARLQAQIETIHADSRGTYGVPRVHAELAEAGVRISRRRVARLMKQAGLEGVSRRRRYRTTRRDGRAQVVPDLVNRNFTVKAPNRLWVADITYVSTWSGFLYLAIVLDAYSRRVVGWSMANHLRTEFVLEALNMAIWQRRPEQVVHHSDQGTQGGFNRSSQHLKKEVLGDGSRQTRRGGSCNAWSDEVTRSSVGCTAREPSPVLGSDRSWFVQ